MTPPRDQARADEADRMFKLFSELDDYWRLREFLNAWENGETGRMMADFADLVQEFDLTEHEFYGTPGDRWHDADDGAVELLERIDPILRDLWTRFRDATREAPHGS